MAALLSAGMLLSLFSGTGLAAEGENPDQPEQTAQTFPVHFVITPADAQLVISEGIGCTYTEPVVEPASPEEEEVPPKGDPDPQDPAPEAEPVEYNLEPGEYTAVITREGCYASVFSFRMAENGVVKGVTDSGNVWDYLKDGVFTISLTEFAASEAENAWDGVSLDVSWYDEDAQTLYISTPAQLVGLAAIVNGIYNMETTAIWDDADGDGTAEAYTPQEYAQLENRKIRPRCSEAGTGSNNMVTTNSYWYGAKSDDTTPADLNGQTVLITADLDMGGWQRDDGTWTGARYTPIGGQYLMHYLDYGAWKSDGYSHLGSSFNGTLDGQGHTITNIYCDRYGAGSNYGDSASIGLIGRLGIHDNDPAELAAVNPTVRNIAVTGYFYGRRSVGGIVGKTGRTSAQLLRDGSTGAIIENCLNFAQVKNTDTKGCGGIVGAGWNAGVVRCCANFGPVSSSYACPTGGISGSNEISLENCYNVGQITCPYLTYAMAIGTNNGGASVITNCYWLRGTATGGGYYNGKGATEITDNYQGSGLSAEEYMQTETFVRELNGTGRGWVLGEDGGYPIPRVFTIDTTVVTGIEKTADPKTLQYVEGQTFDPTGLEIYALYSDQTRQLLTDYQISPDRPLEMGDTTVTISGTHGGQTYHYEYQITVVHAALSAIRITQQPDSVLYARDETFSPAGMVVKAYYTNAPDRGVILTEEQYHWKLEDSTLTVSYTYGGVTKTDTCQITWLDSDKPQRDGDGAYLLKTENDLRWFANQVNALGQTVAKAVVQQDITVTSRDFAGIGCSPNAYIGSFDGDGHTITLQLESDSPAGLFAVAGEATIRGVTVAGTVTSTSSSGTAGLVGYVTRVNDAGSGQTLTIADCSNTASVTAPGYAGGLLGKNVFGAVTISDSDNSGAIQAQSGYAGGIAGYSGGGLRITGCTNSGSLQAGDNTGGIIGSVRSSASEGAVELSACENRGTIRGDASVGGIAGYLAGSGETCPVTVRACANTGSVTGQSAVGGIAGYAFYRNDCIESSYNAGDVTATGITINRGAGGIAGCNQARICNVYNLGDIQAVNETAAKQVGVGGIVGTSMGSDAVIQNAYHAGTLASAGDASCGSMVGYVYFSMSLKNTLCLQGPYCGLVADGRVVTGEARVCTERELMAAALGEAFRESDLCGFRYPVLTWQTGQPHTFDAGVVEVEPTCTKPGQAAFTCIQCGMIHTEPVAAIACASAGYSDVPARIWYHDAVDYMVTNGYMNGMGGGRFQPDGTVTRAQLVTMLYRLEGQPSVAGLPNPFVDVPGGKWYTDAIRWGASTGVVNGVGDGQFQPDGAVTREQIATMLFRYAAAEPVAGDYLQDFPDGGEVSRYAVQAMNWAVANGVINGSKTNGVVYLLPRDNATRAQIAQLLTNWLRK